MHPTVGEVDFHAVDVVDNGVLVGGEHLLHLLQDGVHVGLGRQVDAVLGDEIVGELLPQLAHLHALLSQRREEQGDSHEGITTIVALGVDNATIAFTANHGAHLFHLRGHVHLAHGGSRVLTSMLLRHIAQGTGGTKVRDGVAFRMRQHIIGHADQRIFLAKHRAVLADERQSVHVGVDHDAQVILAGLHLVHDALQVLLQRFGIVGEVARRLAVENRVFHTQLIEQLGQDDTTHRVDGVHTHTEMRLLDGIFVHQAKRHDFVDVPLVGLIAIDVMPQVLHVGIFEVLLLGNLQHLGAVLRRQELTLAVQQLQGVPLTWVVRGGDDDATVGTQPLNSQLRRRRGGEADVHHVVAHAHDGATHHIIDHHTRDAGVAADNNGRAVLIEIGILSQSAIPTDERGVGRCELHDVKRIERVARATADGSANTRYRLD